MDIVEEIIALEWEMFTAVPSGKDRPSCQDNRGTFDAMRRTQAAIWPEPLLRSWLADLRAAKAAGRNLMTEKYLHMMRYTHPEEYAAMRSALPPVSPRAAAMVDKLTAAFIDWTAEVERNYPRFRKRGRPLTGNGQAASVEVYLRGELLTWSEKTLELGTAHVAECLRTNRNLPRENLRHIARLYGYDSLEAAERALS